MLTIRGEHGAVTRDLQPAAATCEHYDAVEVDLLLDGERVAWWCPDCETQLEPDWQPPPWQFLDARRLHLIWVDSALRQEPSEWDTPPDVDPDQYVPTDHCCRCGAHNTPLWWRHRTATASAGAYCRTCDPLSR